MTTEITRLLTQVAKSQNQSNDEPSSISTLMINAANEIDRLNNRISNLEHMVGVAQIKIEIAASALKDVTNIK